MLITSSMRETGYFVIDTVPVVYLERRADGPEPSADELRERLRRFVSASRALCRYAYVVGGTPREN